MIFLNLFLAILLENFEVDDEEDDESILDKTIQTVHDLAANMPGYFQRKYRRLLGGKDEVEETDNNSFSASRTMRIDQLQSIRIAAMDYDKPPDATQNL
jgi:hypothetical protein